MYKTKVRAMKFRKLVLLAFGAIPVLIPAAGQIGVTLPWWFNSPANAWMKTPVGWLPALDSTPAAVRYQRDNYFDGLIGLPASLTPATVGSVQFSDGATVTPPQELPAFPNRELLIATFGAYQPVFTASRRSIYTEITFHVARVFEDAGQHVTASDDITLILPGGTVRTTAGEVLSFLTRPRQYSIAPGRTYLLVMAFHSSGIFYMSAKEWDLTDGTVQANFANNARVPSTLVGLTTDQLINTLNARFGIR
jgi:hypothetical protein